MDSCKDPSLESRNKEVGNWKAFLNLFEVTPWLKEGSRMTTITQLEESYEILMNKTSKSLNHVPSLSSSFNGVRESLSWGRSFEYFKIRSKISLGLYTKLKYPKYPKIHKRLGVNLPNTQSLRRFLTAFAGSTYDPQTTDRRPDDTPQMGSIIWVWTSPLCRHWRSCGVNRLPRSTGRRLTNGPSLVIVIYHWLATSSQGDGVFF